MRRPLGQIFDVIAGPIPVIDDLARTFGLNDEDEFDTVGRDGVVSLLDLAVLMDRAAGESISPFLDALVVLDTIRRVGDVAGLGPINFGSFVVPANVADAPGTLQGAVGPTPLDQADTSAAVLGELANLADKFSAITGLELSLLEESARHCAASPQRGFTSRYPHHLRHPGADIQPALREVHSDPGSHRRRVHRPRGGRARHQYWLRHARPRERRPRGRVLFVHHAPRPRSRRHHSSLPLPAASTPPSVRAPGSARSW